MSKLHQFYGNRLSLCEPILCGTGTGILSQFCRDVWWWRPEDRTNNCGSTTNTVVASTIRRNLWQKLLQTTDRTLRIGQCGKVQISLNPRAPLLKEPWRRCDILRNFLQLSRAWMSFEKGVGQLVVKDQKSNHSSASW